jgi:hypothetical protein
MNTLPNELVRKIYQYIHPAFDYCEYIKNKQSYIIEKPIMDSYYTDIYNNLDTVEHTSDKMGVVFAYCALMNDYLTKMKMFISKNPKFNRPPESNYLSEHQYITMWSTVYTLDQMISMEQNIMNRRRRWTQHNPPRMEIGSVVDILTYGSVNDLRYSCIINLIDFAASYPYGDDPYGLQYKKYLAGKLMKI